MKAYLGRRSVIALVVAGAVVALGGGMASATIPDSDGVIHACYKKSSANQGF